MVVGHCYKQQRKSDDATKPRCRKRPLIDRNSENLEHDDANCHVGQSEQNFHQSLRSRPTSVEAALPLALVNLAPQRRAGMCATPATLTGVSERPTIASSGVTKPPIPRT